MEEATGKTVGRLGHLSFHVKKYKGGTHPSLYRKGQFTKEDSSCKKGRERKIRSFTALEKEPDKSAGEGDVILL